jgi:hypothetical protein
VWAAHRCHRKVGVFGYLAARQFVDPALCANEFACGDEATKHFGMDALFHGVAKANRTALAGKRERLAGHGTGRHDV